MAVFFFIIYNTYTQSSYPYVRITGSYKPYTLNMKMISGASVSACKMKRVNICPIKRDLKRVQPAPAHT